MSLAALRTSLTWACRFNEVAGPIVTDWRGGTIGYATGCTFNKVGPGGHPAIGCNGITDFIKWRDDAIKAAFDVGSGSFTVSIWANIDTSGPNNGGLFTRSQDVISHHTWGLYPFSITGSDYAGEAWVGDEAEQNVFWDGVIVLGLTTPSNWHMNTMVFDKPGNLLTYYIDDAVVGTLSLSGFVGSPDNDGDIYLGSYYDLAVSPLKCDIALPYFWNDRVLSPTDIIELYDDGDGLDLSVGVDLSDNLNVGLVSAYEMEMLSGPIIDSVGPNNLTPGADITYGDSLGLGDCIHVGPLFPAGSAQISNAAQVGLKFGTGPFTIEGWIWLRDPESGSPHDPCDCYIVSKYASGAGYLINVQRSGLINPANMKTDLTGAGGVSGNITFAGNGSDGRHQFVVTRLGGVQKIYVDGVLDVAAGCTSGSMDDVAAPFCLGTWPAGDGSKYVGPLDRVRLWNVCYTDAKILKLCNNKDGLTLAQLDLTITSVDPDTGSTGGNTRITITGTGFVDGATVTFGGLPAFGVVVNSSTHLTCITDVHAKGAVDVVVTNPDDVVATLPGGYTYVFPAEGQTDLDKLRQHPDALTPTSIFAEGDVSSKLPGGF